VAWGLRNVSSRELSEWAAFYGMEPFGDRKADYRAGMVAATIANVNRAPNREPFKPDDFFPERQNETEDDDDEEPWRKQQAMAAMITLAFGGEDRRTG
jgi:hypothetical protein